MLIYLSSRPNRVVGFLVNNKAVKLGSLLDLCEIIIISNASTLKGGVAIRQCYEKEPISSNVCTQKKKANSNPSSHVSE